MHKFTIALVTACSCLFASDTQTFPIIKHVVQRQGHYCNPGKYQGDRVLIFTNGSQWKVHADDQSKCYHWVSTDPLSIKLRKTYYCKWDHSFIIQNENPSINESVRAMLIDHGPSSTFVAQLSPSPHYGYTQVTLSDGFSFEVLFNKGSFSLGDKVYVIEINHRDSFWNYALIKGTETNNIAIKAHFLPKDTT